MRNRQYLLAKYVPDLRRGESRNIGVILWTPDGVEARFLGEKPGRPGEVDGRTIPSFVTRSQAYRQWVEYWQGELARTEIAPATGGQPAKRELPAFLDALKKSGKGNFVLTDGGQLLDPVSVEDLPDAVNHLFSLLVEG